MFEAEEIRQLTMVFAIMNYKVGKFACFERADLVTPIERIGCVDR